MQKASSKSQAHCTQVRPHLLNVLSKRLPVVLLPMEDNLVLQDGGTCFGPDVVQVALTVLGCPLLRLQKDT